MRALDETLQISVIDVAEKIIQPFFSPERWAKA